MALMLKTVSLGNISDFNLNANNIFSNPASISNLGSPCFSYTKSSFYEINFDSFAASYVLDNDLTLAAGYMQSAITGLAETSLNDYQEIVATNDFDYTNWLFKVGLAKKLNKEFSLGISSTFYQTQFLDDIGNGLNFDTGVFYTAKNYQLSFLAANFIPYLNINFDDEKEKLPLRFITSAKYLLLNDLDLLAKITFIQGKPTLLKAIGLNYDLNLAKLVNNPVSLNFSLGYYEGFALDELKSSFTYGIGLTLDNLAFNYAVIPTDFDKELKNYFTFSIKF